jgi:Flp pilus assembly protein TadG
MMTTQAHTWQGLCRRVPIAQQRGAIAIIVALSLAVLIGFVGIATDTGRLFVNKSELQNAADACALAASNELVCDTAVVGSGGCPAAFLSNAQKAGIFVASRASRDFQKSAVAIDPNDVKFSTVIGPNSTYKALGAADVKSKFVMCTARSTGIVPWFMGVMGVGAQNVSAAAVATLAPSASFCDPAPMGICKLGAAPSYGLVANQWLKSDFTGANNNITAGGKFQWVDYTAVAGGTPDLREILEGTKHFCGVKVSDSIQENGAKVGTKESYNTRFGLYKGTPGAPTALTAPPDRTGYAYPTKSPPAGFAISYVAPGLPPGQLSAYADYRAKQGTSTPYSTADYPPASLKKPANEPPPVTNHALYGVQRRVVGAPIIDCASATPTILAMGCVLMLNPMGNGNDSLFLEYLGLATSPSSPCRTAGVPGGAGGTGTLVPTLAQ